jgi:Tfp pilus assembly protein FimV
MRSINLLLAFLFATAAPAIAQEPFVVLEYRSGNSTAGGASTHQVRSGETLAMIVAKYYGRSAVGRQIFEQIVQSNPRAFVGANPNRLLSGVVLRLPSSETGGGGRGDDIYFF